VDRLLLLDFNFMSPCHSIYWTQQLFYSYAGHPVVCTTSMWTIRQSQDFIFNNW
jgi:hypothetical protein